TITVGAATKLGFTQQPNGSTGGVAFGTQPKVAIQDAGGNTVTTDSSSVTLALTTPAGATLGCTANPTAAAGGIASFAGCKIDKAGTYTLTATDGALTSAVSNSLTISVGAASQFLVTPSTTTPNAGSSFTVTLTAADAGGNTVTSYIGTHTVTWTGAATSPGGNAPSYPTSSVAFTNGVSTTTLTATLFAAGNNDVTASATSPAVTGTTTATVSALTASRLAWTSASNSAGTLSGICYFSCTYTAVGGPGTTFKAKVSLTDAYGNLVNATGAVTVTVTKSSGTFTGSATVTIASGTSQSSTGGDGTVAGEITFTTRTGSWTTDTLSMSSTPSFTGAAASFSKP
ncbi:MAG: hypothetical protein ABR604_09955, partial [Jatrophihabitantaceae bacterium]